MTNQILPAAALAAALTVPAVADVHLTLNSSSGASAAGDTFTVTLRAVGDGVSAETVTGVSAVFGWDPDHVTLLGWTGNPELPFSIGMLYPESTGVNEADPPADGDAFAVGFGGPADYFVVPANGSVDLGTLEFRACTETKSTVIDLIPATGPGDFVTSDLFGAKAGSVVTGTLLGTSVEVVGMFDCNPCPADVTGDGLISVQDIIALFLAWGTDDPAADIDDNGIVGVSDVIALVAQWGSCDGAE